MPENITFARTTLSYKYLHQVIPHKIANLVVKLEKLNRELEKSEKKLRKAINDEKALQHQLKQLTRKERTHRLCTRGGMLESFLQEPERLTDDDVMLLLKLIFHRQDTQDILKKLLEREKPETP